LPRHGVGVCTEHAVDAFNKLGDALFHIENPPHLQLASAKMPASTISVFRSIGLQPNRSVKFFLGVRTSAAENTLSRNARSAVEAEQELTIGFSCTVTYRL
jgi:hypothetical protein